MNLLKIINIGESGHTRLKYLMFFLTSSKLLSISGVLSGIKTLNLSQGAREFTIKFYSSRLNIRPYNKLSKEVEDFRDSEDKYIYTRH